MNFSIETTNNHYIHNTILYSRLLQKSETGKIFEIENAIFLSTQWFYVVQMEKFIL